MMAESLNFYERVYSSTRPTSQQSDHQVNSLEYIQNKEKPLNRLKSYMDAGNVTVYDENIEDKNMLKRNNIVVR